MTTVSSTIGFVPEFYSPVCLSINGTLVKPNTFSWSPHVSFDEPTVVPQYLWPPQVKASIAGEYVAGPVVTYLKKQRNQLKDTFARGEDDTHPECMCRPLLSRTSPQAGFSISLSIALSATRLSDYLHSKVRSTACNKSNLCTKTICIFKQQDCLCL